MSWTTDRLLHGADYNYEQWLDRPEILEQDFDGMERAGCNIMTVGIFSWSKYEPRQGEYHFEWMDRLLDRLHERGIGAILATPSGSKPAWLSKAYPETCQADVHGHREPHGGRHNHCRTSPDYRRLCVGLNTTLAERYGKHPALRLWHVSNEYGSGRCYCPACLEAFRGWLRARYGDLDGVNRAWWTDFWSHRFDSWDQIVPDATITGMMLDWARFTSDQTIDFFQAESRPLRELTPNVPVTTNFHGPNIGLDYFEFAKHVDVVSWDAYPRWHVETDAAERNAFHHDLMRSAKGKAFLLMESTPSQTNWQGVSPLKRPGMHTLASLQAIAHGSDSVQYFQWRQSRGGQEAFHGSVLTLPGSFETRTFREVAEVGRLLGELDPLAGTSTRAKVAVVLDYVNQWALDQAQLPQTLAKDYWNECLRHHSALARQGFDIDVIDSVQDFSSYSVVIAPMLYLLRPGVAQALEAFVEAGGILVAGYLAGMVDDCGLVFEEGRPGPLAHLLGLTVEETDALPEGRPQTLGGFAVRHYADLVTLKGAEAVEVYDHDFYAGTPALTRRRLGKGQAWYVAGRTDADFLGPFLAQRCREAGVKSWADAPLPPGVEVRSRLGAGTPSVFVLNFNESPVSVQVWGRSLTLGPLDWRLLTPP